MLRCYISHQRTDGDDEFALDGSNLLRKLHKSTNTVPSPSTRLNKHNIRSALQHLSVKLETPDPPESQHRVH